MLERFLILMVICIPISYIGIFSGINNGIQAKYISWYMVFILLYIMYIIYKCYYWKKSVQVEKSQIFVLTSLVVVFFYSFFRIDTKDEILEWIQLVAMIFPVSLTYVKRKWLITQISEKMKNRLVSMINSSILACAFGVITQFILYTKFNILIGLWTFYPGRTVVDLLITGYSVLSLILSCGIIINLVKLKDKIKFKYIFCILVMFIAMIINSSRTGVMSMIIIMPFISKSILLKNKRNLAIGLLILPIFIFIICVLINIQLKSRGTNNLFDNNGRFDTYSNAFNLLFGNVQNLLIGCGLSIGNYDHIIPHNFILETLLATGILFTGVLLGLIIFILRYIRQYKYFPVIINVFLGSMVITNFQANYFAVVYMIIAIISVTI